ncbi:hypothetical protein Desor_1152 [Desulfosporosinus orientis DSM 765]|uniref:Uncharacterized protein n=1 Tax=Desulfosporosinus orientis (strain ATCC 19365 / DSM 765 / NCIMB 8382 / VKM B-1628 / Singapore I) TaxID=768706 RepID=G7WAQ1_DESOD|nr:hypothetical protein [Desulfosporosinus orientis]AET66819.1 hypothetical protein Desor_1152 [Desulfosporosinus orientis DSM 765]
MFYHYKHHYHSHGMLFLLSLVIAFILGRKSERYGFSIISRGCGCSYDDENNEMDRMNNPTPTGSYQQ